MGLAGDDDLQGSDPAGDLDQAVGILEEQGGPFVGSDPARPADGEGFFVEIPDLEEAGQRFFVLNMRAPEIAAESGVIH